MEDMNKWTYVGSSSTNDGKIILCQLMLNVLSEQWIYEGIFTLNKNNFSIESKSAYTVEGTVMVRFLKICVRERLQQIYAGSNF